MFYYHTPRLHRYDPRLKSDAEKIMLIIAKIKKKFQNRTDLQFLELWHFVEHNQSGPLSMQD
ncbi:hypothetical protein ACQZV8_15600 [Magnetococcales bacterium HHB-1]